MPGQRAQRHSVTATKLASPHSTLPIQSSQTRYLLAATSTSHHSRLFCHGKSPSQITPCLQVRWSDAYAGSAHAFSESSFKTCEKNGLARRDTIDWAKAMFGYDVEVVKRNEMHTFKVLPKLWIVE
jgi:hypothetical protein